MYAPTRISQRIRPLRNVWANSGSRPVNNAANHPITTTTMPAIPRKNSTMSCGMARMMRKTTVNRCCFAVPENHISTRLVGMDMEAFVMSPPCSAPARRAPVQRKR